MINGKLRPLTIAKTSIASKLAQKAEETQVTLPEEYTEYAEVFSKEASQKMPPSRPYDHPILLNKTFVPKIGKIYPLSPDEQEATDNFIEENLQMGKIRPSSSPQVSSFFYVRKKDSGLRPCQDYWYIYKHTIKYAYPLPLISDLTDMVKDATIFTKFDIWSGYNNIRIKEGDQWKAAFITSKGLFKPTVMFFGLSNSPATFQRFMNNSFKDMIAEGWLIVYMDDMLIMAANEKENVKQTRKVLQRMKELDLHLKLKKCKFGVKEVDFLGLILQPREITMDSTKLSGIAQWPIPTKVKDVQSFLGFTNYYRRFIGDYSNIARPLIDLTKKNQEWKWSPSCQKAFDQLKEEFSKQPILSLPDLNKPFAIATDTSKDASGGILLQADSNGEWHPCSYLSQSFSPAERNYNIYDRELLVVIWGLKTWKHYLRGSPFPVKVFTNHKNLLYFKEPHKLNRRQVRWMLDISDYNLKLIHVPGKELAGHDALSRRPDLIPRENNDNEQITLLPKSLFVNTIDLAIANKIAKSSEKDPVVPKTLQAMDEDLPTQFRSWLSDWSYNTGILSYQGRIYIPDQDNLRLDLVKKFHDHQTIGHPGYLKTKQLLTTGHWWPGMAQFIKKYVDGCAPCQQNKTNTHPTIPPLNPIISRETLPFKQISYDLITDLLVSNGFDSLLVMVDQGLSKGVILCPTKKTITTKGVAMIIFQKLYTRFRLFIVFFTWPCHATFFKVLWSKFQTAITHSSLDGFPYCIFHVTLPCHIFQSFVIKISNCNYSFLDGFP